MNRCGTASFFLLQIDVIAAWNKFSPIHNDTHYTLSTTATPLPAPTPVLALVLAQAKDEQNATEKKQEKHRWGIG